MDKNKVVQQMRHHNVHKQTDRGFFINFSQVLAFYVISF